MSAISWAAQLGGAGGLGGNGVISGAPGTGGYGGAGGAGGGGLTIATGSHDQCRNNRGRWRGHGWGRSRRRLQLWRSGRLWGRWWLGALSRQGQCRMSAISWAAPAGLAASAAFPVSRSGGGGDGGRWRDGAQTDWNSGQRRKHHRRRRRGRAGQSGPVGKAFLGALLVAPAAAAVRDSPWLELWSTPEASPEAPAVKAAARAVRRAIRVGPPAAALVGRGIVLDIRGA